MRKLSIIYYKTNKFFCKLSRILLIVLSNFGNKIYKIINKGINGDVNIPW